MVVIYAQMCSNISVVSGKSLSPMITILYLSYGSVYPTLSFLSLAMTLRKFSGAKQKLQLPTYIWRDRENTCGSKLLHGKTETHCDTDVVRYGQ